MKPLFEEVKTDDNVSFTMLNDVHQSSQTVPAVVKPRVPVPSEQITDQQIEQLGSRSISQMSGISNKMLGSVRASDADAFGDKLNELIGVAKGLDPSKFRKSGLIYQVTNLFGSAKEKMLSQYSTVESRMNSLIGELDKSMTLHTTRINDLGDMYTTNMNAHNALQEAAKEGERMLGIMKLQIENEQEAKDAFAAQRVYDMNNRMLRLEKRIDDLKRAMLLAKQAAPEILLLQDNARTLAAKFKDVEGVTIPAWRNAFTLYLVQLEQQKGAQLVNAVHDATDEAFRLQADLLRQNTQDIARAKQRSVVSIETLAHVQQQLLGSFDDMNRIADEGRRARKEAEPKIRALEQELVDRFLPKSN